MQKISIILLAGLLLLVAGPAASQSWQNGRLSAKTGFRLPFAELQMEGDSISYIHKETGHSKAFHKSQVIKVEVVKGSHALEFGLAGGGGALLGSLLGTAQVNEINGEQDHTGLILGLTAGGTLLGIIIGSQYKKYRTVYENDDFMLGLRPELSFRSTALLASLKLKF